MSSVLKPKDIFNTNNNLSFSAKSTVSAKPTVPSTNTLATKPVQPVATAKSVLPPASKQLLDTSKPLVRTDSKPLPVVVKPVVVAPPPQSVVKPVVVEEKKQEPVVEPVPEPEPVVVESTPMDDIQPEEVTTSSETIEESNTEDPVQTLDDERTKAFEAMKLDLTNAYMQAESVLKENQAIHKKMKKMASDFFADITKIKESIQVDVQKVVQESFNQLQKKRVRSTKPKKAAEETPKKPNIAAQSAQKKKPVQMLTTAIAKQPRRQLSTAIKKSPSKPIQKQTAAPVVAEDSDSDSDSDFTGVESESEEEEVEAEAEAEEEEEEEEEPKKKKKKSV